MLRVLYLVFNQGYSGDVDLAAEAIRLTRQLAAKINHEEVAGLLALMLLDHARRPARTGPDGRLVPLAEQDRSLWDTRLIAEGVDLLQTASPETAWARSGGPISGVRSQPGGPPQPGRRGRRGRRPAGRPAALAELDPALARHAAAAAYLHERDGDPVTAARLYAEAARSAPSLPERDHLTRQAARLNAQLRS